MTDEGKGADPELAAELGYFVTEKKASVRDLQSTILHLTGLDACKLKVPYQGLDQKLIGPADEDHLLEACVGWVWKEIWDTIHTISLLMVFPNLQGFLYPRRIILYYLLPNLLMNYFECLGSYKFWLDTLVTTVIICPPDIMVILHT